MAKTGYKITVYLDDNPLSPTYMQTYEERTLDEETCPIETDDLVLVSNECEIDLSGYTGYRLEIYYNRTTGEYTENRVEDPECIESSDEEEWVASGDPFCETTDKGVNTGYMLQLQVQMNPELANYGEKRYQRWKSPECGSNDCPIWDEVSRQCHIEVTDCVATFDGTSDIVQIDINPLSTTYNQTRTVNKEDSDCENCTQTVFSWVLVGDMCGDDSLLCNNGIQQTSTNSYTVSQKYKTIGNGTPIPMDEYQVVLKTEDDEDCGYIKPQYRWDVVPGQYLCDYETYTKYEMLVKMVSYDAGETWATKQPLETQRGDVLAYESYDCGKPLYRWTETDDFVCVDNGDDWKMKIVRSNNDDYVVPCNESATLVQSELTNLNNFTDATLIDFGDCINDINCYISYSQGEYSNRASLHFGDYIEYIGDGTHNLVGNYVAIDENTFGENVKYIRTNAFKSDSIRYADNLLHLGSSIEYIGDYAFYQCVNLNNVIIDTIIPPTIGTKIFLDDDRSHYPEKTLDSIQVPSDTVEAYKRAWTEYSQYIFSDGEENTFFRYTFPNNVKGWNVGPEGRNGILDKHITHMSYKGLLITDAIGVELGEGITSIGEDAFNANKGQLNVTGITMPSTLQSIGNYAFAYQSGITSVDMSNCTGLTSIGDYSFRAYGYGDDATGLTSVTIPNTVQTIGESAFYSQKGLVSVNIPTSLTSLGGYSFWHCSMTGDLVIPSGVTSIGMYTFGECSGLTSISIQGNVSRIGSAAFRECISVTSLTMPHTVSVDSSAFKNCSGITGSLSFGGAGAEIGEEAFLGCSGITSLELSDFSYIGRGAFSSCTSLSSVTLNCTSNAEIDQYSFTGCRGLKRIDIGSGCTRIRDGAFSGVRRKSSSGDVEVYDIVVYVYATTPPEIFTEYYQSNGPFIFYSGTKPYKWIPTIYVPSSALATYQSSLWQRVGRLEAMP